LPNYSIVTRYIPIGSEAYVFENIGAVHSRCFVLFIDAKALEGTKGLDPFKFEPLGVTSIKLERGSEKYDYDNIDFAGGKYGELYSVLIRCLGSGQVPVTIEDSTTDTCIFPFNLSLSNPLSSLPMSNENTTRVHVSFKTPLAKQYCAVFLIPKPKIMSISANRMVQLR